jgi:hypothetical protein
MLWVQMNKIIKTGYGIVALFAFLIGAIGFITYSNNQLDLDIALNQILLTSQRAQVPPVMSGLAVYFPLDEGAGTTVTDSSGAGIVGRYTTVCRILECSAM